MLTRRAPQIGEPSFLSLDERPGDILIQNRDLRYAIRELDGIGQIAAVKLPFPDRPRAFIVIFQAEEVFARSHSLEPAKLRVGEL